jgi:hypothetical protein
MTDTKITQTSAPVDSLVMVSADQDTIVGNGTRSAPLQAASSLSGFRFLAHTLNIDTPFLGTYMTAADFPDDDGIFVAPGDARPVGGAGKQTCGFVIEVPDPPISRIQCGGIVTLSVEAWDFITLGEGLSPGTAYYLSNPVESGIGGSIQSDPPADAGEFVVLAGIALSSTSLLTTSVPGIVFRNPP